MWKTVLAGTTALVIAGGTLAIAQSAPPAEGPRTQQTTQDTDAALNARIARIKERLRLTADQEKQWPAVESALRDIVKARATRISERRAAREAAGTTRPDAIDRMRRAAEAMTTRAGELKTLADATDPLYKTLDDRQKRQLTMMLRNAGRLAMGGGRRDGGRFHHGPRFNHHNDRQHG